MYPALLHYPTWIAVLHVICFWFGFVSQLHQAQNECQRERTERCKLERLQMQHHKQVLALASSPLWYPCVVQEHSTTISHMKW